MISSDDKLAVTPLLILHVMLTSPPSCITCEFVDILNDGISNTVTFWLIVFDFMPHVYTP